MYHQQQQQQQAQQPQQNNALLVQGRIVWTSGNLFEGKKMTDDNGKPILDENGQQCVSFGFGLAVPKMDAQTGQYSQQFTALWQALQKEALSVFPSGAIPNDFAWKYKDGDQNDHNGVPFANREGYKGCIVIACTTQIPIKYFKWEGGNNILINSGIKCGDYVNVQLNIKGHPAKGRGKSGLYLNPTACQLIAPGKEIINTPSGDQMFGMAAPVYVAGQIEAPAAPSMPNMNGQQQMPQQNMGGMPPMNNQGYAQAPQQQNYAPAPAPAAPQQHYDVLPNQFQQAPQQQNYATQMPGMPGQQPQQQQYAPQQGGMPSMPGMPR